MWDMEYQASQFWTQDEEIYQAIPRVGARELYIKFIIRKICKIIYQVKGPLITKEKRQLIVEVINIRGYQIPIKKMIKKLSFFK